ncbi:MAG: O-antigen ligase family protein [Kiloniellaceae bacterium]
MRSLTLSAQASALRCAATFGVRDRMSLSPILPYDDDAQPLEEQASAVDGLRVWEWLFLLFVLMIAAYALALQPTVQTLAWYLIYLAAFGFFLLRYGAFLNGLWVALPLLLWVATAGLSYFWSDAPGHTARATVQLGMTVLISLYLGARFTLFDLTRALFAVLAIAGLVSLAAILVHSGFAFDHNGTARGIFPHKNVLGGRMVLLLVCCLLLFILGWHRLLVTVAAIMGLALVALSESGTSVVMTLGLCALAPLLLTRHAPAPIRLMAYLVSLLLAAVAAWAMLAFDLDPVGMALHALGKDRTLTGRSVLWEFAESLIEARPLLGSGFDAFWNGGDTSASHYVQYLLQQQVKNFHNSYLDIWVQLGVVGLTVTTGFLLLFAWRAVALLRHSTEATAALPAFFVTFVVCYSLSEYALFRQHSLIQILLGALYVSAALALPGPRRRQASPASWPET